MPSYSERIAPSSSFANQQPKDGPRRGGNTDIVKAPQAEEKPKNIPMQYSSKNTQVETIDEEDVQTFLSLLANSEFSSAKINNVMTHKAHTNYWAMLAHITDDLSIPDGGADSHVVGKAWLLLTPLSGPGVKYANVVGFDEQSAKKFGLPIVSSVTKATTTTGKTIFLRALHSIYNGTSPHTLLSNYHMREVGLIVDDVSKRHLKDANTYGSHSIQTPQGHVIELRTRGALPTFNVSKPTIEEYHNAKDEDIIDIALKDWNPQDHHEEILDTRPPVVNSFKVHQETSVESMINFISQYEDADEDPFLTFMDCQDFLEENSSRDELKMDSGEADITEEEMDEFHDCQDYGEPSRLGKVMHLSIDYQQTRKGVRGVQPIFIPSSKINTFLSDIEHSHLIGKNESFDSLACALSTVEQLQKLEALQPKLAWKPLEVIKKTLESTTQWGKQIMQFPMKKHHASRFPWNNRRRLREEVAMDTIFMKTPGFDGSTCAQVFLGLMSRMINVYPMPSKASGNIFQAYQDFMQYEGVPEGLHRDLAPEEKVDNIIKLNRDMMVKDSWSESGNPNQNPVESQGVYPLKKGAEQIMNRTGAEDGAWPWALKYIAQVNNICATPVLGWKTPVSVRHGYTPDISAYLQFQFWECVYFKVDDQSPGSKEAPGYWLGISEHVGDLMTYDIWSDTTKKVVQRSIVRSADPNKGGIPNLRVDFQEDEDNKEEAEIVEPTNILDNPSLICPSPSPVKPKKHKVRWHDSPETQDVSEEPPLKDAYSDFGPKISVDELDQSHPNQRK